MSPTIREAQNAGAFLLAVCAIFVPYFPADREHYIIFYYIIICQKTTPCQLPASPPNKKRVEPSVQFVFYFLFIDIPFMLSYICIIKHSKGDI